MLRKKSIYLMFWSLVGALLFVFVGIPIAISLLGQIWFWKLLGWLLLVILCIAGVLMVQAQTESGATELIGGIFLLVLPAKILQVLVDVFKSKPQPDNTPNPVVNYDDNF